ncbi:hypothetical protein [Sporosarcina sp. USHLN248]|uniref:hypothetical protein n=1 Tax=Sporosarcina sp. USHLN248 TaxID=3081300 RepID=UPI00301A2200
MKLIIWIKPILVVDYKLQFHLSHNNCMENSFSSVGKLSIDNMILFAVPLTNFT